MGIIVTVSPVVAAVAALAAKGAALYEDNHSYRVRLDPPVGEKELPGLRRAWIAIRADGPGTVCLSGRLPDGDDLWEEEGAPPEMAVGYWADARDAAHEIYRATARESAVRREAVRLSGGTWSAGRGHAACNDDPADAAPGDTAVLTLRGGTRLTRKGDDEHKWQWSSHDRIRYEDAETLAVLADDTAVGLPRSMALPVQADDYRRAWYDDPLAAAVADAIAHAVDGGEAAPLWERQLMGDIPAHLDITVDRMYSWWCRGRRTPGIHNYTERRAYDLRPVRLTGESRRLDHRSDHRDRAPAGARTPPQVRQRRGLEVSELPPSPARPAQTTALPGKEKP